ncbi:DnaJ domain-containing protein [Niabella pedocola]|uniref:DnaJ domain-containing protein n=1 Tax=Niabella pedocola TaxID=1752077 RepID=A0ABS8PUS1_9BACT|nr:DnaJ domain-containing protein [Niabella pedocola]MCD2424822.1 DnaJ domain-containing protein [Niabella pedocola]
MDYKKDYYRILEVPEQATPEELRASYRRLAKRYHPDKNPGNPDAEDHFKDINEAYEMLGDPTSRAVYDSYRTRQKKEEASQDSLNTKKATHARNPHQETKTRTYTVIHERKIYVQGVIEAKFQGMPDLVEHYAGQWETCFTITPTEILVTISAPDIYAKEAPDEYQRMYSGTDIFTTPIGQPVCCKIVTAGKETYYQLDLYDIRIKDPRLDGITKHEQYSFGTLRGELFAYVLHRYEEEVTETYTACVGTTGRVETKTEGGQVFTREEQYTENCDTRWTEWRRVPQKSRPYAYSSKTTPVYTTPAPLYSDWWWLLLLLVAGLIWPPLFAIILILAGILLLPLLLVWMTEKAGKGFHWVLAFLLGAVFLLTIGAMLQQQTHRPSAGAHTRLDNIRSKKEPIQHPDMPADTLITHTLRWQDRNDSVYTIQLSVRSSQWHQSARAHRQMNEQQYASLGIGGVYSQMLATDQDAIKPAVLAFGALAKAKKLNRSQTASMILSCIQSIPYALVVDRSCSDSYNDTYINQYLATCKTDCCKGYSKFGVQSPAEFLADLKGDCDTRALFLYSVLGELGYPVALMTSNYYKHAVIAVAFDKPPPGNAVGISIDKKSYYLWETTSKKFGPGELPASLSNIHYWNITLIQ